MGVKSKAIREGVAQLRQLRMDFASRMRRAADQGYISDKLYHATDADVRAFDLNRAGTGTNFGNDAEPAVFLRADPDSVDGYLGGVFVERAKFPHTADLGDGIGRHYSEGSNVQEVMARLSPDDVVDWDMGGASYDADQMASMLREAREEGKAAVILRNFRDPGVMTTGRGASGTTVAVLDPSRLRSTSAAFDPAKQGSSDLLASVAAASPYAAAGAVGTGALLGSEDAEAGALSKFIKAAPEFVGKFGDEAVDGMFDSLGGADDFLYHVTSEPNAKRIMKRGGFDLYPRSRTFDHGVYSEHGKGRVFLTERDGVPFWQDRVEDQMFDQFDNPPDVVVLRVPRNSVDNLQLDEIGTKDAVGRKSYFVDGSATPSRLAATAATGAATIPLAQQLQQRMQEGNLATAAGVARSQGFDQQAWDDRRRASHEMAVSAISDAITPVLDALGKGMISLDDAASAVMRYVGREKPYYYSGAGRSPGGGADLINTYRPGLRTLGEGLVEKDPVKAALGALDVIPL